MSVKRKKNCFRSNSKWIISTNEIPMMNFDHRRRWPRWRCVFFNLWYNEFSFFFSSDNLLKKPICLYQSDLLAFQRINHFFSLFSLYGLFKFWSTSTKSKRSHTEFFFFFGYNQMVNESRKFIVQCFIAM